MITALLQNIAMSGFLFAANAHEGTNTGGGGDSYAAHFAGVGKKISLVYERLCSSPSIQDQVCQLQTKFSRAVAEAKVLPRTELTGPDGEPREAGPAPAGDIYLNVPLYQQRLAAPDAPERVIRLAAHEYMIAAFLESEDNYDSSRKLVELLRTNFIDFAALVGASPVPWR